jgi:hypothetical protein
VIAAAGASPVQRALDVFCQVAAERIATLAEFQRLRAKMTARCATERERAAYDVAGNKLAELGARFDVEALRVFTAEPQTPADIEAKVKFNTTLRLRRLHSREVMLRARRRVLLAARRRFDREAVTLLKG